MSKTERPLDEVNRIGLEALVKALGPADAERFIEHCRTGIRDYTQERRRWLGSPSVREIVDRLRSDAERGAASPSDDETLTTTGRA